MAPTPDRSLLSLDVLSAHNALAVVEEIQIEDLRIDRDFGGDSACFRVDLRRE